MPSSEDRSALNAEENSDLERGAMTAKGARKKAVKKTAAKKTGRGPGRLSAEDAANLEGRLLDAAMSQFSANTYGDTTMDSIAKAAGASTKTLYSRYTNKEELLGAVVVRLTNAMLSAYRTEAVIDPASMPPNLYLVSFGRQICTGLATVATGLLRLALTESHRNTVLRELFLSVVQHGVGVLQNAFATWRSMGLLPLIGDTDEAADLAFCLLTDRQRVRAAIGIPMTGPELEKFLAAGVSIFLRGCGYTKTGAASATALK